MGEPLVSADRSALLSEVHVGVLGISRLLPTPLVVPVWYLYERDVISFIIMTGSLKHRVLVNAGVASLCVQEEDLPYRYVTAEGAVSIRSASSDFIVRLSTRYLGREHGARYAMGLRPDAHVLVELVPERWLSDEFSLDHFGISPT